MRFLILLSLLFIIGCSTTQNPSVATMQYNDHTYLVFKVTGQYGQTYVHDPDCKCYRR